MVRVSSCAATISPMSVLLLIPVILSLLVLGAHCIRLNSLPLAAACLVLIFLLSVPRQWVMRLIQAVLVIGSCEWLRTTVVLYHERQAGGGPWMRMVVILAAVALITAGSAALFETKTLRRRYAN